MYSTVKKVSIREKKKKKKNILGARDVYASQAPSVIVGIVVAVGGYGVEVVVVVAFVCIKVVVDLF